MKQQYKIISIGILVLIMASVGIYGVATENGVLPAKPVAAQDGPTSTPASVNLPTNTPPPSSPTDLPTSTATISGPITLEARSPDTNVRAEPDITANRLGTIQPGNFYEVLSRRFEWFQIRYPDTPSQLGWVHESVVNISGDVAAIPELGEEQLPTTDPTLAAREETEIAVTQTPGAPLTLTAQAFITPEGIFTADVAPTSTLAPGQRLPTFTFPPFTNTPIRIEELRESPAAVQPNSSGFPPIVPMVGLGALGLLGLLVGILRRM
jgi:hypothetical protein